MDFLFLFTLFLLRSIQAHPDYFWIWAQRNALFDFPLHVTLIFNSHYISLNVVALIRAFRGVIELVHHVLADVRTNDHFSLDTICILNSSACCLPFGLVYHDHPIICPFPAFSFYVTATSLHILTRHIDKYTCTIRIYCAWHISRVFFLE